MQDPTPGPTPTPRPSHLARFSPLLREDDPLMTLDSVSSALAYLAFTFDTPPQTRLTPKESDGLREILRTMQGAVEFVTSSLDRS